jgi:hypothetical protein
MEAYVSVGRVVAAALVGAVALPVLAGCGGDSGAPAVLPSDSTPTASGSDSGAPTTSVPPGPRFTFPPDVRLVFEVQRTGNGAKDAVLRDWEISQRAFVAAETVPDPAFPALVQYQSRAALAEAVRTLRLKKQRRHTVIGTRRYYSVTVGSVSGTAARIVWCVDDSGFFARDVASGRALRTTPGPRDYYRVQGTLLLNPRTRIWTLVEATSKEGVQC